uniref:Alternative protein LOC100287534 n=1 Tax=Homo sapiens TaxID=9606 RepID=L8E9G8_HUMAN|nr:alternative protein LOC100287534 [Homo sapiens]
MSWVLLGPECVGTRGWSGQALLLCLAQRCGASRRTRDSSVSLSSWV